MNILQKLYEKVKSELKANSQGRAFFFMVLSAFVSGISLMQLNSYAADKYHLNAMWWTIAILSGIFAAYNLYVVSKGNNNDSHFN